MKRLLPPVLLAFAASASCTLDVNGLPGKGASSSSATVSTSTGSSSATTGVGGAGGAGGSGGSPVTSSASSSGGTGGGPVWTRREVLDLDCGFNGKVDGFPVLVAVKTGRIDYAATQDQGQDLRFTDAGGKLLAHEIERWDENGTSFVWVRVEHIDQTGSNHTQIQMYYGNPSAADAQDPHGLWSSTYAGVWHLSQNDDALADSTGKTANAVNHGSTRTGGVVGDGRAFSPSGQHYIDTLNTAQLNRFTIEAWAQGNHAPLTTNGPNGPVMREKNYQIMWDHFDPYGGTFNFEPVVQSWTVADFKGLSSGTWYYLAATFDGTKLRSYKDGVQMEETTLAKSDAKDEPVSAKLGKHAYYSATQNFFDGMVDEVRISSQHHSDNWIKAQDKSMRDAGFVTFGMIETGSFPLP